MWRGAPSQGEGRACPWESRCPHRYPRLATGTGANTARLHPRQCTLPFPAGGGRSPHGRALKEQSQVLDTWTWEAGKIDLKMWAWLWNWLVGRGWESFEELDGKSKMALN